MVRKKVVILFGGQSAEHYVSIASARAVFDAVDVTQYQVGTLGITRAGAFIPNVNPIALEASGKEVHEDAQRLIGEEYVLSQDWLALLRQCDVVFPVLHGPGGEDGTMQGFLDILRIPYVGSKVLGSALCMDKAVAKDLMQAAGLPIAPYFYFTNLEWQENTQALTAKAKDLGLPIFVKPANLGSSVGISKVKGLADLPEAVALALQYDHKVIIEKGINGQEVECSVLGNHKPLVATPGEIKPSKEFYDYNAKYIDNASELIIPARLTETETEAIKQLSLKAFKIGQCQGLARIDFFVDYQTREIWLNEINTLPGFTRISMYPKLWGYEGLSFTHLVSKLLELALSR